jgi:hypothetical protein
VPTFLGPTLCTTDPMLKLCAGPLARYHAGMLGAEGAAIQSPLAARDWRARFDSALAAAQVQVAAMEEDAPQLAAELDWGPYGSLVLWAAYLEQPQLARPPLDPLEWHKDPALARCLAAGFRTRFPTLVRGVELWLPYSGDAIVALPAPAGDDVTTASLAALALELEALNAETWRAATEEALAWREGIDRSSAKLEDLARRGYAIFSGLCAHAARDRLALWLDY